jgi:hypothetical protein
VDEQLRRELAGALGEDLVGADVLHGGDVARSYRIELAGGRVLFAKTHPNPPPGFFTT